jgi:hypothetical protein
MSLRTTQLSVSVINKRLQQQNQQSSTEITESSINHNYNIKRSGDCTDSTCGISRTTGIPRSGEKREQTVPPTPGTYVGTYRKPLSRRELIVRMNKLEQEQQLCMNQYPIGVADDTNNEYNRILNSMTTLSSLSISASPESSDLIPIENTGKYNGNTQKKQPPLPQSQPQQRVGSFCYPYYQKTMLEQLQETETQNEVHKTPTGNREPIAENEDKHSKYLHMSVQEQQETLLQEAKHEKDNEIVARMIQESEMLALSQIQCQLHYDTQIAQRLQDEINATASDSIHQHQSFDNDNDTSDDMHLAKLLQQEIIEADELERKRIEQLDYKIAKTLQEILYDK